MSRRDDLHEKMIHALKVFGEAPRSGRDAEYAREDYRMVTAERQALALEGIEDLLRELSPKKVLPTYLEADAQTVARWRAAWLESEDKRVERERGVMSTPVGQWTGCGWRCDCSGAAGDWDIDRLACVVCGCIRPAPVIGRL